MNVSQTSPVGRVTPCAPSGVLPTRGAQGTDAPYPRCTVGRVTPCAPWFGCKRAAGRGLPALPNIQSENLQRDSITQPGLVVLLRAEPGEHAEVASFAALEGKTWNHPVVVGDRLYVRNAQEAACYQFPLAEAKTTAARL